MMITQRCSLLIQQAFGNATILLVCHQVVNNGASSARRRQLVPLAASNTLSSIASMGSQRTEFCLKIHKQMSDHCTELYWMIRNWDLASRDGVSVASSVLDKGIEALEKRTSTLNITINV